MKYVLSSMIVFIVLSCGLRKNKTIEPMEKTIWINSFLGNCSEMELKEVYLVTQETDSIDKYAWECRHHKIEGFEFERGYISKIKVAVHIVEGIPQYKYLETIEKTRDPNYYRMHDIWSLIALNGEEINRETVSANLEVNLNTLTIIGNGGCNSFRGSIISYSDDKIKFGPVMSTKMACHDSDLESDYLAALDEVHKFEFDKNDLVFKNQVGIPILRFKKVD